MFDWFNVSTPQPRNFIFTHADGSRVGVGFSRLFVCLFSARYLKNRCSYHQREFSMIVEAGFCLYDPAPIIIEDSHTGRLPPCLPANSVEALKGSRKIGPITIDPITNLTPSCLVPPTLVTQDKVSPVKISPGLLFNSTISSTISDCFRRLFHSHLTVPRLCHAGGEQITNSPVGGILPENVSP